MKGYEKYIELLEEYSEEELNTMGYKFDGRELSRCRDDRFEVWILGTWYSIPRRA